jgi:hypothetical protein
MQPRVQPHFHDSLKLSNSVAQDARWEALYRAAWPGLLGAEYVTDVALQRLGYDRLLTLADASVIAVEEKYDAQAVENLFLEYWSNLEAETPGWIRKPLRCNYFCYVCPNIYTAYILPWPELQAAWVDQSEHWVKTYGAKYVRNPGYTTVGVAVPIEDVLIEIPGWRSFDWPDIEPEVKGVFSLGGRQYSRY